MRTALLLLLAIGLAAVCPAPIERRLPGTHAIPEVSDETLSQVQAGAVTPSQPTPQVTIAPSPMVPLRGSSGDAEAALYKADQVKSVEALTRASRKVDAESPNPMRATFFGGLFIALGVGAVFGMRRYADKLVPVPPLDKRSKRQGSK